MHSRGKQWVIKSFLNIVITIIVIIYITIIISIRIIIIIITINVNLVVLISLSIITIQMAHSTLPFKSILNFIERSTDKRNGESLEINNIFFYC